jgi:hypothetical protein
MNKFEQLIEYVNNGEDAKAEELFHEIVVDKSRDIYESLMDSENEMGGDEADELINDISSDEEGMREDEDELEAPEMGGDEEMPMGDEMGEFGDEEGEADLEDRVVDLEDQLDALMAEFDAAMGDEEGMGDEMPIGDEEMPMGDEEMEPEMEEGRFNEAVSLTKVTKGIANSSEEEGTNKKSVNADNSGKKGAVAKPQQSSGEENGRSAPEVKAGDGTTEPNESKVKEPKKSGEDGSTNKKSISGS